MGNTKTKKSHTSKVLKVASLIAFLLLLLGVVVYARMNDETPKNSDEENFGNLENSANTVDANQNKNEITENQQNNNQTDEIGKIKVVPTITIARKSGDIVEVRSFISEVYESTGKCTATFTNGGNKITRTVEGIKDVSYTRCDRVAVPIEEFNNTGGWEVTVSYSSDKASGVSDSREVTGL